MPQSKVYKAQHVRIIQFCVCKCYMANLLKSNMWIYGLWESIVSCIFKKNDAVWRAMNKTLPSHRGSKICWGGGPNLSNFWGGYINIVPLVFLYFKYRQTVLLHFNSNHYELRPDSRNVHQQYSRFSWLTESLARGQTLWPNHTPSFSLCRLI